MVYTVLSGKMIAFSCYSLLASLRIEVSGSCGQRWLFIVRSKVGRTSQWPTQAPWLNRVFQDCYGGCVPLFFGMQMQ
ncbi:MAG: hypothetical protein ACTS73_02610 [Arsenophonus sp. NEOnobi-MAG3]